jgi:hypothetical protein
MSTNENRPKYNRDHLRYPSDQSWLRIFEQGDKWNLGLTAGMICLRIRSDDEETSPPEPHSGIQG